jgi:SAM-dependent methyltransferase
MESCRLCSAPLSLPEYAAAAPALLDGGKALDVPTEVFVCDRCGLAQSPDFPDMREFYAHEYKVSLNSADHDQIITLGNGKSPFRTDFQTEAVLNLAEPPSGARVLDFGSGKASTLKKLRTARPDIVPYVFDVSEDYRPYWTEWLHPDNVATHKIPDAWRDRFDLVTAHFVLEHVAKPADTLRLLATLLAPAGKLYLSVPNSLANPGDLLVVDHLSHFSKGSLCNALLIAGLRPIVVNETDFPGALLACCEPSEAAKTVECPAEAPLLRKAAAAWQTICENLVQAAKMNSDKRAAIYGAGFYGSYIRTVLNDRVNIGCFIDANPHLQGTEHLGLPVISPETIPDDIAVVYAGLNPLKARQIISKVSQLDQRKIIWLE